MSTSTAEELPPTGKRWAFLPDVGTMQYHLFLGTVAILVLGPLGAVTASYMNFSLGFFVGGQVLAGILGSAVTYGYGPEGKHGANFMQTMAASVASVSAMAVLIQAMVWLGMPQPESWKLALFMCCIGMFGVGVGMLFTPILVDRMKLEYPSGHAVANILRALTDVRLLKRSIGQLGGGTVGGIVASFAAEHVAAIGATGISTATLGSGLVIGSRIAIPGLVMAVIGVATTPYLKEIGWLGPNDPFRKIGFVIALAMIVGAALVDLSLIAVQAIQKAREAKAPEVETGPKLRTGRLYGWTLFWAFGVVLVATQLLGQPPQWVILGLCLAVLFVFVNGIATGISDSNPISSAFVLSVLLMSLLGLQDPVVALLAASVLLVATSVGVDMQQDRSTGWRLGTPRDTQFVYQVIGIVMGSILCVGFAHIFMTAFPVLTVNSFDHPEAKVAQWQSAMTYKFVGAIRDLGHLPPHKVIALELGLVIGIATEVARKLLHRSEAYRKWTAEGAPGFAAGWAIDALFLPSPYASSFGGFVEYPVCIWQALGGTITSVVNTLNKRKPGDAPSDLPEDMSSTSLIGGGLIAGESLFFLGVGISGLYAIMGAAK